MALILPYYMNTVVALGTHTEKEKIDYHATGFLYGHHTGSDDIDGSSLTYVFLVTNRHVANGPTDLRVRFNTTNPTVSPIYHLSQVDYNLVLPWTLHPDPDVDVAVRLLNSPSLEELGIDLSCFRSDKHVITHEQANEFGISEGDGGFVLGFPLGLAGDDQNYVIARQGIIARIQGWLNGVETRFLIDASIFPGNSGGPVLTKPESVALGGTKYYDRCSLIGMVSSYVPYQEIAVSTQTGRTRMVFEENSGLGVVVPISQIEETTSIALEEATEILQGTPTP